MELKGELLELFKEIEHGDQEHRDWLYNKMLEFQNRDSNKEDIFKKYYLGYYDIVKDLIDEEGWVYVKEAPYLLDASFENIEGKQIEYQKSFGFSGDNPHWETKGARWRPKELSIYLKENLQG